MGVFGGKWPPPPIKIPFTLDHILEKISPVALYSVYLVVQTHFSGKMSTRTVKIEKNSINLVALSKYKCKVDKKHHKYIQIFRWFAPPVWS